MTRIQRNPGFHSQTVNFFLRGTLLEGRAEKYTSPDFSSAQMKCLLNTSVICLNHGWSIPGSKTSASLEGLLFNIYLLIFSCTRS